MAEEWWLDYSAAKLSGDTIRRTPVGPKGEKPTGAIRYIDAPGRLRTKHTNKAEYDDLVRSGIRVLLVFQNTTEDASTGWNGGVANAHRALDGAKYLGYDGPIFFCNDRTTVKDVGAWRSYLDGAASVLGKHRVGAYGFFNALNVAVGHASYFWQAGRRADVVPHANIWQDNNYQPRVGGIATDRNLILRPIVAGGGSAAPAPITRKAPKMGSIRLDKIKPGGYSRDAVPIPPWDEIREAYVQITTGFAAVTKFNVFFLDGGKVHSTPSWVQLNGTDQDWKANAERWTRDFKGAWVDTNHTILLGIPAGTESVSLDATCADGSAPGFTVFYVEKG